GKFTGAVREPPLPDTLGRRWKFARKNDDQLDHLPHEKSLALLAPLKVSGILMAFTASSAVPKAAGRMAPLARGPKKLALFPVAKKTMIALALSAVPDGFTGSSGRSRAAKIIVAIFFQERQKNLALLALFSVARPRWTVLDKGGIFPGENDDHLASGWAEGVLSARVESSIRAVPARSHNPKGEFSC
ncbi:MAG: hypothetical protein AB1405_17990, partial [Bdellovibrionota bacterium]